MKDYGNLMGGGGTAFHGFLVWKPSMTNAPGCGNIIFTTAGIFFAAHRQAKMGRKEMPV
ncbi:MAG: hypothetical protein R3F31_25840 [Verrucomicrobiales bacterium]